MKHAKYLYLVLGLAALLCCPTNTPAQNTPSSNTEILQQGNQAYGKGQFSQAATAYENVRKSGQVSADLYYNLGNAYYKQAQYPQAILNYERALLLNPSHADAKLNLAQAQLRIDDKVLPSADSFIAQKFHALLMTYPIDYWAWLSVVAFLGFLILLAVYLFGRSSLQKKMGFFGAALVLCVSITGFVFAYLATDQLVNQKHAIIFSPSVTVQSAPTVVGKPLSLLHEGTKVKIVGNDGDWYQIQLPDQSIGWLQASTLEII